MEVQVAPSHPAVQWTLLSLPTEVMEAILLSPALRVPDLCRMRRVCWRLCRIVDGLWTRTAAVKWNEWGSLSGSTHKEWFSLCRQRSQCEDRLAAITQQLSRQCFKLQFADEDELAVFSALMEKEKISHEMLLCVLTEILQVPAKSADMTEQFYALHGKEYIIRQRLSREWKELLQLPNEEQTMERGAVLVAQWMCPCHCQDTASINKQLDSIAEMVAVELLKKKGKAEEGGEEEDTEAGISAPKRPRQQTAVAEMVEKGLSADVILPALNSVLYGQLGFKGAGSDSYYQLENSYIDKVLERKTGIPITLSAVYEAVARRLGLRLQPVNSPRHFLLKLPHEEPFSMSENILIDAYSRGQRLSGDQFAAHAGIPSAMLSADTFSATPAVRVYLRYLANIYNVVVSFNIERTFDALSAQWLPVPLLSVLSLRLTLCPLLDTSSALTTASDMISIFHELRYSPKLVMGVIGHLSESRGGSAHQMDLTLYILMMRSREIEEQKRKILLTPISPKRRPGTTNVKYRVGMIMKHRMYDYRCVIYGWDEKCTMSEAWIAQMGVNQHPPGSNQPFYNVMSHDGSNRYASQANLMECPAAEMGPIPHWEVGKYFTRFTGQSYTPNVPLSEAYPDDL